MRIHHFTVPAREPARVAAVLAEILGARVLSLPHPVGAPDLVTLVHGSKPTAPPDVPVGQGHLPMG